MLKPKPFKIPKTLGLCADLLYTTRANRLLLQKEVDALEEQEKLLKEHIINTLPKSDQSGASGKLANVKVLKKLVPQVKDWDAFYLYVGKNKRWDLMQRRLSDTAVKEMWDSGKKIPGVESFDAVTVSITKV